MSISQPHGPTTAPKAASLMLGALILFYILNAFHRSILSLKAKFVKGDLLLLVFRWACCSASRV